LGDAISAVVKWLSEHLSFRYLGVIAFVTGLLIFLPLSLLAYFGLDSIAAKYRGIISLVFLFSSLLAVTEPLETKYREWAGKGKIRGYLNDLPGFERALLKRCLLNDGQATRVISDEGPARSLEKKDILWKSAELDGQRAVGYSITHPARQVLKEPKYVEMFK
jgi:hypothetical protein